MEWQKEINKHFDKGEIIIYQPDESSTQIEVRIDEETVWLTQAQMEELFSSTQQNISLHIKNIYMQGELIPASTYKDYLLVQMEGTRRVKRKIALYNLDVIISVGYRVKSQRGTQFRIWANGILKEYLLKGYAINQRFDKMERKLWEHEQKFELLIKTNFMPSEGIFYDGQIFDAYVFASEIIKSAERSIVLIDNYIDNLRFNVQYPAIEVKIFTKSHDRFLIIDHKTVYHIGASLKDLGKKWFAFSKIGLDAKELLKNLK